MKNELINFGLTKNQAEIYIALLNLGSATANEIAKEVKIHRTNIYDSLQNLIKKGLASYIIKNKVKIFQPTDPENIRKLLKEKESQLNHILPKISSLYSQTSSKSYAKIYEGVNAFVNILYNFLEYNQPILAYGIPKIAPEMMRFHIHHFHNKRIPRKITMKHIYNFENKERINELNKMVFTEARALPIKYDSNVSTNICGDEVVLVIWTETPKVIQIINKEIADSYRNYFEILWKNAK